MDYQQQTFDISVGNNVTSKRNETITYEGAVTRRDQTFNLYAILIFTSAILALIKSYAILKFCRRASIKIHQMMCGSVINSAMTFMDNHFIGNILNRFSYDLDVIDEQFPFIFMEFFRVIIQKSTLSMDRVDMHQFTVFTLQIVLELDQYRWNVDSNSNSKLDFLPVCHWFFCRPVYLAYRLYTNREGFETTGSHEYVGKTIRVNLDG